MLSIKTTFRQRASEVETYYNFILNFIDTSSNDDLNKILKSNLILMLYNLVESSISNAIEEIHNNIHSNHVSFDLLRTEIREKLIKYLKNNINSQSFVASVNDLAIDIVKKGFNKEKVFNGNVDSRKVRELGNVYGFNVNTTYLQTKSGACLVDIKGRRNDLAHGVFSFTEVGKNYSLQDLENMKNETIHYISEIIDNIESYLNNKEYKEASL